MHSQPYPPPWERASAPTETLWVVTIGTEIDAGVEIADEGFVTARYLMGIGTTMLINGTGVGGRRPLPCPSVARIGRE